MNVKTYANVRGKKIVIVGEKFLAAADLIAVCNYVKSTQLCFMHRGIIVILVHGRLS